MRALLAQVAGGTLGVDRPIDALDDLHKLQHSLAWGRTGLSFGSEEDKARLAQQTPEVADRIDIVRAYLDAQTARATTREQPPEQRWRGLAASINPAIPMGEDWPQFAAELDIAANAGLDVAGELHRITKDITNQHERVQASKPTAPHVDRRPPEPSPSPTPPPPELAAAGYHQPPPGPRR